MLPQNSQRLPCAPPILTDDHNRGVFSQAHIALSQLRAQLSKANAIHDSARKFQLRFGRKSLSEEKWTGAGFVGSLWGLATYLCLPAVWAESLVALALGTGVAIYISHVAERALGHHDDSRIVIDEWIGAWIALWMLPQHLVWPVVVSFILFRVFDTFKGPWGGHTLQKLPGGFGVTLDDVVAGIIANVITRLLIHLHF